MVKYSVSVLLPNGDTHEKTGMTSEEGQAFIVREMSQHYPYIPIKMTHNIFSNLLTRPHLNNAVLRNLVRTRRSGEIPEIA
jgi:hypothetical protein